MASMALPMPNPQQAQTGVPGVGTPVSGAIPVSPAATVANPTQAGAANPYAAAGAVPAGVGSVPTSGPASTVQNNGINWADGSKTVTGDLQATYGAGTGSAIAGVLQNMGTVNDAAIQSTIANTDLAAGKEYANIQSGEAAAGVTANSSTAALAGGDFYSGVNSNLQQTIGGMEVNEENTLLGSLTNLGENHGPDSTTMQGIMGGIGDAVGIAGAATGLSGIASGVTSMINPNADTGILDSIAGL